MRLVSISGKETCQIGALPTPNSEASVSTSLSVTAAFERVLQGSATSTLALSTAASGIEKWEPVDEVTDTWTPVAATSETWTPVTWSRAA